MSWINVETDEDVFLVDYGIGGSKTTKDGISYTWYRGTDVNFNPDQIILLESGSAIENILKGWMPKGPMIKADTAVTAFGSCFAGHIRRWLNDRNFNVLSSKDGKYSECYVVSFGEGLVNTYALRQQFEWAWENKKFEGELWHGYDAKSFGYNDEVQSKTREIFDQTDVFILTLGLSEVWYDKITNEVFWRAIPRAQFDESRHKFRVVKVAENKENLEIIYNLIRKHRPNSKIIFTLSPIPLMATFRPVSCMSANAVSKASLRAALDEFMFNVVDEEIAYYWPSYDIINELFKDPWDLARHHIKQPILDFVMTLFEAYWCEDSEARLSITDAWSAAHAADQFWPNGLREAIASYDLDAIRLAIGRLLSKQKFEEAAAVLKWAQLRGLEDKKIAQWVEGIMSELKSAQKKS